MKKFIVILIIFLCCIITFNARIYADIYIEPGLKKLTGETEYSIGDYSFKSLLEFPLNSYLLGGKITSDNDSGFIFSTSGWFNITKDAGIMKDSDWLYGYGVIGKDIYSESDAYLDKAVITDFKAEYLFKINENLRLIPNLGFKYQRYKYTVEDTVQYGALDSAGNYYPDVILVVDGKVLLYDVKYKIPYIGLDANYSNENILLELGVGFSPITTAEDRDDHLLRYKLSKGNTKGSSTFFDIGATYRITSVWYLKSKYSFMRTETSGKQEQYFYDGENKGLKFSNIANEINLKQNTFDFGIEYRF